MMKNGALDVFADKRAVLGCGSHLHTKKVLRKNTRTYYGMTRLKDQQIRRFLDALDHSGQADNALVVFTRDHGRARGYAGNAAR